MNNAVNKIATEIHNETGLRAIDTREIMRRGWPRSNSRVWHAELAKSGVRTLRSNNVVYVIVSAK